MNILIADAFPGSHLSALEALGYQIRYDPELDDQALPGAVAGHEVLVVRSTRVTAEALAAGSGLALVIRAGAGTNTIDKKTARARDIAVCNVPGANAAAVAELAMGLILCLDRNIPDNVSDLRAGTWNKKKYSRARGLHGRNLAILGIGAIGAALAARAQAFGMHAFTHCVADQSYPARAARASAAGIEMLGSREELLSRCDVVSLHLPATGQTRGLVDAGFLAQMQDGAFLVNTSRGELVDDQALIDAMDRRGIRAGLDVYNDEPGAGDSTISSVLARHPGVIGTHHIGASTAQAQDAVADGVLEVIASYRDGNLIHCVNV